jgi:hypothetical protein
LFDISLIDSPRRIDPDGKGPVTRVGETRFPHRGGSKRIPWDVAREMFVATDVKQVDLANLIGCAVATLNHHVMEENWHGLRATRRAEDADGTTEHRKELKEALERSRKTQETGAQLALASLTIIAENLREWHERKRAFIAKYPDERFPEKLPLKPADVNALTTCMQRLEQWDRAKVGSPDLRLGVDVRTIDLTAMLDRANVVE